MKWNLRKINFTVCSRQILKNTANVNKKVGEMLLSLLCPFLFCLLLALSVFNLTIDLLTVILIYYILR